MPESARVDANGVVCCGAGAGGVGGCRETAGARTAGGAGRREGEIGAAELAAIGTLQQLLVVGKPWVRYLHEIL